jgi:excisionase family DNA binding protein
MPKVMTLEETADYLRVHPSTVYRLLKKRRLPGFKVGSDWRFNLESIDRWREEAEKQTLTNPKDELRLKKVSESHPAAKRDGICREYVR